MKLEYSRINYILTGLFFLIFPSNAYFIFGNIGKVFCLIFGSSIIFLSLFKFVYLGDKKTLKILIGGFLFLLIFIYISYAQDQYTFTPLIITFSIVNYFLFISGFLINKFEINEFKINNKLMFLFSLLTIISCYYFYNSFTFIGVNSIRGFGFENLNAIGVAYSNTQLALIFLFLLQRKNNLFMKLMLILSLVCTIIIVLITESRGPFIFLILTVLIIYYKSIFDLIFNLKKLFFFLILILSIFYFVQNTSLISNKLNSFNNRLISLFSVFTSNQFDDTSSLERIEIQLDFFANYHKMFLGKYQYKPYPHNQFIEIFMRWGVFGIPILIISLKSIINAIRFKRNHDSNILSLKSLVMILFIYCYLQSFTSLSLDNNRILWLGFGMFMYNYTKQPPKSLN
tara:strand:- start:860 stop:2056 length:1197 start_codon:yes stop_codon:yes gene_type:complete